MYVKRQKGWEIPERLATPESVYLNRRQILAASGFGMAAAAFPRLASAETDPSADLYPAPRNSKYTIEREVTPEAINTNYNNFYEFGTHKNIASAAEALPIRPWEVKIDGLVETEITTDFDTLIRKMPLEERLYRHRCVEAWSMVIPWLGFSLSEILKEVEPTAQARFHHGPVDLLFGEIPEGHAHGQFEKGRVQLLDERFDEPYEAHDLLAGHQLPVDLDPLAEIAVVGRGIEPGEVAGPLQRPCQKVSGRALAIGAGQVDRAEAAFRMVQSGAKCQGVGQVFLESRRTDPLEHRKLPVEERQGLLVGAGLLHAFGDSRKGHESPQKRQLRRGVAQTKLN